MAAANVSEELPEALNEWQDEGGSANSSKEVGSSENQGRDQNSTSDHVLQSDLNRTKDLSGPSNDGGASIPSTEITGAPAASPQALVQHVFGVVDQEETEAEAEIVENAQSTASLTSAQSEDSEVEATTESVEITKVSEVAPATAPVVSVATATETESDGTNEIPKNVTSSGEMTEQEASETTVIKITDSEGITSDVDDSTETAIGTSSADETDMDGNSTDVRLSTTDSPENATVRELNDVANIPTILESVRNTTEGMSAESNDTEAKVQELAENDRESWIWELMLGPASKILDDFSDANGESKKNEMEETSDVSTGLSNATDTDIELEENRTGLSDNSNFTKVNETTESEDILEHSYILENNGSLPSGENQAGNFPL